MSRLPSRAILAVAAAACVILAAVLVLVGFLRGHEIVRSWAAAVSAAVAATAAVAALLQYWQNSRDKRIERSMEFWRRANSGEVKDDLDKFIDYWRRLRGGAHDFLPFEVLARTTDDCLDSMRHGRKRAIENLLDFYDEACTGVVLGTCDDAAMYLYLGPLMIYHVETLTPFMRAWREQMARPEKWDCLTRVTAKWRAEQEKYAELCRRLIV